MLKQYATYHLHPENPVVSEGGTTARCYFDRPSAPQQLSLEEAEEGYRIMEESKILRNYAGDYDHSESPVTAAGPSRKHVDRLSSVPQERYDKRKERVKVLQDTMLLKQHAVFHLHPELPVTTTDYTATGRNYFDRPSAPDQETVEEMEEHDKVINDVALLSLYAKCYLHPELPVEATDPSRCARCYFDRPSAPEKETIEEMEERNDIMKDVALLKMHAKFYLHPELPVERTDPARCARCYFDRPSAPARETYEEKEEYSTIMEDLASLKMYAKFYMHPELPVETTDSTACERCYFDRPSAPDMMSRDEAEERHLILQGAAHLEALAQIRLHDHVLERDYFHCHFPMDEEMGRVVYDDNPITDEKDNAPSGLIIKTDGEGNLSRSPSSIFGFE